MFKNNKNLNIFAIIIVLILIPIKNYAITLNDFTVHKYKVPSFKFKTADNQIKDIKDYKNKTVILSFWSTWCRPCLREIFVLSVLNKKITKDDDIEIIPVSIFPYNTKKIENTFRNMKITNLNSYTDYSNAAKKTFKVRVLPTSYVINKEGDVVAEIFGLINWLSEENISYLKKISDN